MRLTLNAPWLEVDLGAAHRVLSWSINHPGFVTARRILWREVRNADLPPDLDVAAWLDRELEAVAAADAVVLLTSRRITAHHLARATVDAVQVACLATVGLSNGERVGSRVDRSGASWGTINLAVQISAGLTDAALIEALSIATEARTAAVMDHGFDLPKGRVTGTGTDCIAVAAPPGATAHAGLHTALGEAIGRAVYDAVSAGAQDWMQTVKATLPDSLFPKT